MATSATISEHWTSLRNKRIGMTLHHAENRYIRAHRVLICSPISATAVAFSELVYPSIANGLQSRRRWSRIPPSSTINKQYAVPNPLVALEFTEPVSEQCELTVNAGRFTALRDGCGRIRNVLAAVYNHPYSIVPFQRGGRAAQQNSTECLPE